jgi:hypothetical protein
MVECSKLLENINLARIYAPDFDSYSRNVFESSVAALKRVGAKNWQKNENQFNHHVQRYSWLAENVKMIGCENPAGDGSLELSDFFEGPDKHILT